MPERTLMTLRTLLGIPDDSRDALLTTNTDLLRKGDRGDDVKLLQHRLNILGWQLTEDSIWGVQTDSAVRGYQYRAGLTVDGIVGAKTRAELIRDAILARAAEISAYMSSTSGTTRKPPTRLRTPGRPPRR